MDIDFGFDGFLFEAAGSKQVGVEKGVVGAVGKQFFAEAAGGVSIGHTPRSGESFFDLRASDEVLEFGAGGINGLWFSVLEPKAGLADNIWVGVFGFPFELRLLGDVDLSRCDFNGHAPQATQNFEVLQ